MTIGAIDATVRLAMQRSVGAAPRQYPRSRSVLRNFAAAIAPDALFS
jgi:hypothetical protein